MPHDVFISYSHADLAVADAVLRALEAAGFTCWMAPRDILYGMSWPAAIHAAVPQSRLMVLVFSRSANESSYVLNEVTKGLEAGLPIIAFRLEDVPFSHELDFLLASKHWLNAFSEPRDDHIRRLVAAARRILESEPHLPPTGSPMDPPPPHPASPTRKAIKVSPDRVWRHAPKKLIGRDGYLDRLDAAWRDSGTHVVSLVAWAGAGKTSLVAHWLNSMAHREWDGAERVYEWSFYSAGTRTDRDDAQVAAAADLFFIDALSFFREPDDPDTIPDLPEARGRLLAERILRSRTLLVVDGLEPLQHPPGAGNSEPGGLRDRGLAVLFAALARPGARACPALCVLTSREHVADLDMHYDDTAQEWTLENLPDDQGAALLHLAGARRLGDQEIGPDHPELKRASREVHGHALTLDLLGSYLARAYEGDIQRRHGLRLAKASRYAHGGHAFRVLEAYEKWFLDAKADGTRQLALLRLMGLFDRPADPASLSALCAPPAIEGLTEPLVGIEEDDWRAIVADLVDARLLRLVPWQPTVRAPGDEWPAASPGLDLAPGRRAGGMGARQAVCPHCPLTRALEAHPLLRAYFAEQLDGRKAGAEALLRLVEHIRATSPDWHEHAEDRTFGPDMSLRPGGLRTSGRMILAADLAAVTRFLGAPGTQSLPQATQAWFAGLVGVIMRVMGRLTEAQEPTRVALQMDVEAEHWANAAISASNLSWLELTLGDLSRAIADAERSVDFAERARDPMHRIGRRAALADARHQAGLRDEAAADFRVAEAMQEARRSGCPLLSSVNGFLYCDLLVSDAERAAWRLFMGLPPGLSERRRATLLGECRAVSDRAERLLTWDRQHGWSLDDGLHRLTLGRVALCESILARSPADRSASVAKAQKDLAAAAGSLRASGHQDHLPRALLSRAWMRFLAGDPNAAAADLDEAWRIAEPAPMRLHMADVCLHRARLFRDRQALAQAHMLIAECDYGRRLDELDDAERAAAGW